MKQSRSHPIQLSNAPAYYSLPCSPASLLLRSCERSHGTRILDDEPRNMLLALISQLRIGMDLSRVVLPVFILEPRSMLERVTDFLSHPALLFGYVLSIPASPLSPSYPFPNFNRRLPVAKNKVGQLIPLSCTYTILH
jgi:hypothetical protein